MANAATVRKGKACHAALPDAAALLLPAEVATAASFSTLAERSLADEIQRDMLAGMPLVLFSR